MLYSAQFVCLSDEGPCVFLNESSDINASAREIKMNSIQVYTIDFPFSLKKNLANDPIQSFPNTKNRTFTLIT